MLIRVSPNLTWELPVHNNSLSSTGTYHQRIDDSKEYDGQPLTNDGYSLKEGSLVTGDSISSVKVTGYQTEFGKSDNVASEAIIKNEAGEDVTGGYAITYVNGTLEITKRAVKITVNNSSKVYGEDDPEFSGSADRLVNSGDLGDITYSRTNKDENDVGVYKDVLIATYTENKNYAVTVVPGTFEITKAGTMVITPTGFNGTYDGQSHTVSAVSSITDGTTVEYSTDGGKTWSTTPPTLTNAGELTVTVRATNPNYQDAVGTCTLKVNKAALVITTGSGQKVFDGTALTNAQASITGLVNGETATVAANGSQTLVGSSSNTYAITWGTANANNYEITERLGSLVVTAAPVPPTPPRVTPTVTPAATVTTPVATPTLTPPEVIENDPTPQATIDDGKAPKAEPETFWALINLLCAIATCLISVLLLAFYFIKRKADEDEQKENSNSRASFMDDQEEAKRHNKLGMRLLGLIPAIGSVVAFILTEDMSAKMQMVDKWTLMMVIILAIEVALAAFSKKTTDDGEEEQGQPAKA